MVSFKQMISVSWALAPRYFRSRSFLAADWILLTFKERTFMKNVLSTLYRLRVLACSTLVCLLFTLSDWIVASLFTSGSEDWTLQNFFNPKVLAPSSSGARLRHSLYEHGFVCRVDHLSYMGSSCWCNGFWRTCTLFSSLQMVGMMSSCLLYHLGWRRLTFEFN